MFKRISFSLHDVIFMRIKFVCMFMCAYRLHAVIHVIYADTFSTGKAVSTKSTSVLHVGAVSVENKNRIICGKSRLECNKESHWLSHPVSRPTRAHIRLSELP